MPGRPRCRLESGSNLSEGRKQGQRLRAGCAHCALGDDRIQTPPVRAADRFDVVRLGGGACASLPIELPAEPDAADYLADDLTQVQDEGFHAPHLHEVQSGGRHPGLLSVCSSESEIVEDRVAYWKRPTATSTGKATKASRSAIQAQSKRFEMKRDGASSRRPALAAAKLLPRAGARMFF